MTRSIGWQSKGADVALPLLLLFAHIGAVPLRSQLAGGSADAAALSCVQSLNSRPVAAMQRLLHQESVPRWPDGWALAERYGPPLAPALRAMLRQEGNALKRLLLVGACSAAGRGSDQDSFLLEIATAKARIEEQTLALLCLAVGPRRETAAAELEALYLDERAGAFPAVGAALASTRFVADPLVQPGEARPARFDSEMVAAAARGELTADALRRLERELEDARRQPGAELALRAALLGRRGRAADELDRLARQILRQRTMPSALVVAAGVYLGTEGTEVALDLLGDPRARAALSAFEPARNRMRELGVLIPLPEVLADQPTRVVLAAAYGLTAPWPAVAADVEVWLGDPALVDAVALSLAWRLLTRGVESTEPAERIVAALPPSSARFWLAWALGDKPDLRNVGSDQRARQIAALALSGQADKDLVAHGVEAELWRAGAHPGRLRHGAWVDLVRDALLAGSDHVSGRLQLHDRRPPLPRGIEPSNGKFFLVADSLHRFFTERVPQPPPELRLQ